LNLKISKEDRMVAIEFIIGKDKKLLLRSYEFGYELCWQRTQKGVKVWTPQKYYASIPAALDKIMQLKVAAADVTTLRDLRTAIENARQELLLEWQGQADIAG
jgi:hypothetical protein